MGVFAGNFPKTRILFATRQGKLIGNIFKLDFSNVLNGWIVFTQLAAKIERLENWHTRLVDKSWLAPLKPVRLTIFLMLVAGLIAAGMNGYMRHFQYQKWQENSQIFYLDDGTPLFTTTDAPYFLGLAQAIKRDGYFHQFNGLRHYPHIANHYEENPPNSNLREAPLLSVVLSLMASDSSTKSLLEAGHRLIPISALLTSFMIIFAFGATGYWLEGTIAAAGGGLSLAYLPRSGAGRIDTDQLNLGFFYLMTGLVIFAARAKTFRASLVLAALAGTVFWVFDWWYSKPFFGWAFFIGFIWLSLVCRSDMKRIILQSVLFLTLSGLLFKGLGISGKSSYLNDVLIIEGLIFPNTFDTITEISQVPIGDILTRISGSVWVGMLSLSGLALWALRHPAYAIVFGPAAAFALLNFVIGNRAIFYSSPMVWFGFAWLVIMLARWIEHRLCLERLRYSIVGAAIAASFIFVWLASPIEYLQGPTFDKKTVAHFQKLKEIIPENNVAIASWWDYGYMSMMMNGRPTLHDGGAQTSPSTYLIANNLLQRSQKTAASELQLLGDKGYEAVLMMRQKGITGNNPSQPYPPKTSLYLVLTADMARWMPSISKIGAFDIKTGKSTSFDGTKKGYQLRYGNLDCQRTGNNQEFLCNNNRMNLITGQFGDRAILQGMTMSKDGVQIGGRKFSQANTPFILHSEIGTNAKGNMIIHKDLYFSVFHQLFYLNKADPDVFTLIYDGFPDMRVFKIF
jgi:undecaprenyl-diphosphooligosaccharide--protein glycosyltransferase